jgi:AhpD family alkylhydroperoxidase
MKARINVFAKGQQALNPLFQIGNYLKNSPVEVQLLELIFFRVSQINNCAYCLDMHAKDALAHGETEQRLFGISAWRETSYFSARERAALAWAEAVTNCDVPDGIYERVSPLFTEAEMIDLTLAITAINSWNRFNLAFPSVAGTYQVGQFG